MKTNRFFATTAVISILIIMVSVYALITFNKVLTNGPESPKDIKEDTILATTPVVPEKVINSNDNYKITNKLGKFSFIFPKKYAISGNESNFSITYAGPKNTGPGIHDEAQLHFRISELNGKSLKDAAINEYTSCTQTTGNKVDLKEVTNYELKTASGYTFSCNFSTPQQNIYLPLSNGNEYLNIIKIAADADAHGYDKELDKVLSTLEIGK